jgi:hypothetical protein
MKIFTNQNLNIDYYIIYINIYKNFYKLHFLYTKKIFMTVVIYYFLLLGFCFALASGLFLGLKSIKLI